MSAGLRDTGIGDDIVELPLADGGEGTLDALLLARDGELRTASVTGPAGSIVTAAWGLLADGTAVVELAQASGLALVVGENDPMTATTRGTGELIMAAAEGGAARVIVAVGGSATIDGGLGVLEALGWTLPLPVVVACDVETLYCDAARIFGPQKGAGPTEVDALTRRLESLAGEYEEATGVDVRGLRGSGAAGGVAGGLAAIGAELRSGFDVVAEAAGFSEALAQSSFVITGEGRLDRTSLDGKVVGRVLAAAQGLSIPAAVVAGDADETVLDELPDSTSVLTLRSLADSVDDAIARAPELARLAGRELGRALRASVA